jgi:hydrogenase maturation factor
VEIDKIPIPPLAQKICRILQIDPYAAIASGALLLTAPESSAGKIRAALEQQGIPCADIGWIDVGPPEVWQIKGEAKSLLPRPIQDEITRFFKAS